MVNPVKTLTALTELGGHHRDVVLGHALPVQELVGGDGALHRVDVKVAVQVALPVDGVPEREGRGGGRGGEQPAVRTTSFSQANPGKKRQSGELAD